MNRREVLATLGFAVTAPYFSTKPIVKEAIYATTNVAPTDRIEINSIFEPVKMDLGDVPEFPVDFLYPSNKPVHPITAYVIPNHGHKAKVYLVKRDDDYVAVPDYSIGSSIDWPAGTVFAETKDINLSHFSMKLHGVVKYIKLCKPNEVISHQIINPAEILEQTYVKKIQDDQWHTLLAAGNDRNIEFWKSSFTKAVFDNHKAGMSLKFIRIMKSVMRRHGIGNAGKLTDLYIGNDVYKKWSVALMNKSDTIDGPTTRRSSLMEYGVLLDAERFCVIGVNIHPVEELNKDEEYSLFYEKELKGTFAKDRNRLVVGLDRSKGNFVMPYWDYRIKRNPDIYSGGEMRHGITMIANQGIAVLDNRTVLLGII